MILLTGDTHGDRVEFMDILGYCEYFETTKDDLMIILGDVGLNYHLDRMDREMKEFVEEFPITFLMIRGNHEERPENLSEYVEKHINTKMIEGDVFIEPEFPSLIFADNGLLRIGDMSAYVINGAYSVDKPYRLANGSPWFKDEELFEWEKDKIRAEISKLDHVDMILSHTCPTKYIPEEAFLPGLDQTTVSREMEDFLDEIEESVDYDRWYCGHWHIDKSDGRMMFLYNEIIDIDES